jgi:hypothetical protein
VDGESIPALKVRAKVEGNSLSSSGEHRKGDLRRWLAKNIHVCSLSLGNYCDGDTSHSAVTY